MPRRVIRIRAAAAFVAAVALTLGLAACSDGGSAAIDVPTQVAGDFPADTQVQLEEAVTAAMTATGSSGAIVGVWAPWSGSWVAGLGTESPDGPAVTADMSFWASRITRAMTCDVLYQVAEKGTVSLDDSVTEYVGGIAALSDVTLKQLCDSTSGIGSYTPSLLATWLSNPERSWDPLELASYGLGAERWAEPGAEYRDSDAGYLLLGMALERATGESAASLLEQYVTEPLGLDSTYLLTGVPSSSANLLTGQRSAWGDGNWSCEEMRDFTDISGSVGFTDSAVVTTVTDLGRYVQALAAGTLMPSGTDRFDDPKPVGSWAPSWYTYSGGAFQTGSLVGSFGYTPGYITGAFAEPDSGLTVVVVLNNSAAGPDFGVRLAWELAAIGSKAPSNGSESGVTGLPWTAEQYHQEIADNAMCAPAQ